MVQMKHILSRTFILALWEIILHWSLVYFHVFVNKVTIFVTDCLFKDICIGNSLEDTGSPFETKGRCIYYTL